MKANKHLHHRNQRARRERHHRRRMHALAKHQSLRHLIELPVLLVGVLAFTCFLLAAGTWLGRAFGLFTT